MSLDETRTQSESQRPKYVIFCFAIVAHFVNNISRRCADSTADETYQAARSIDRNFTTDSIMSSASNANGLSILWQIRESMHAKD
jgi:hypothetical protein